jgi:anti-sigma B factor antagonist
MDITMEITADTLPAVRLAVHGDLDLETAPRLREAVRRARRERRPVRIDLAGVDFIDAAGINVLTDLRIEACGRGEVLRLDNPSGPVLRVARLTDTVGCLGLD